MLFGEHAVLRNGPAIATAIDCRLSVTLSPRTDSLITVTSALGRATASVNDLTFGPHLRYVESVFRLFKGKLPSGLSVQISSSIDPTVGLASSASVTVALLAAINTWLKEPMDRNFLLRDSCRAIRATQGFGSGADAASIIYGGVISYYQEEARTTLLSPTLPLVLIYSGKKTPTPEVISKVNAEEERFPSLYRAIFAAINDVTHQAISAITATDFFTLGELMNHAHGLMEALGVGTEELSSICWSLRNLPSIFGAKISGSGLGDAVIALGNADTANFGRRLPSTVTTRGVEVTTCQE